MFPDNKPRAAGQIWVEASRRRRSCGGCSGPRGNRHSTCGDRVLPTVTTDQNWAGRPRSAAGMSKPLFMSGLGDFSWFGEGFAPLEDVGKPFAAPPTMPNGRTPPPRKSRRNARRAPRKGRGGNSAHTWSKTLRHHPRFRLGVAHLESVANRQPGHVRLTLRFDRLSSARPEESMSPSSFPCRGRAAPAEQWGPAVCAVSRPVARHLPRLFRHRRLGRLSNATGLWLWVSRDSPLVSFGESLARRWPCGPRRRRTSTACGR